MSKFNYRQEAKIITTETTEFSIEADTQEEADRLARAMTDYVLQGQNHDGLLPGLRAGDP